MCLVGECSVGEESGGVDDVAVGERDLTAEVAVEMTAFDVIDKLMPGTNGVTVDE